MLTNLLVASRHILAHCVSLGEIRKFDRIYFFDFEKLSKSCDWWPYGFSQFLSCKWQHHYKLTDLKRKLWPKKSNKTSLKNPIKQLFKWWLDADMVFAVDKLPILVPNAVARRDFTNKHFHSLLSLTLFAALQFKCLHWKCRKI